MDATKKSPEEEFFAKQEIEKRKAFTDKIKKEMAEKEKTQLKNLHFMHCPKCGMELHAILYRGVTIDKCFSCGGVYLDQGELEELAGQESGFLKKVLQVFENK
ncbi:MAG: zf-TFIIB domain-containing protein [Deltaproteobacteria bacterium]|nr:zf-TFIIB domain-containing protein [Deltaproteobacteria bacterium]